MALHTGGCIIRTYLSNYPGILKALSHLGDSLCLRKYPFDQSISVVDFQTLRFCFDVLFSVGVLCHLAYRLGVFAIRFAILEVGVLELHVF